MTHYSSNNETDSIIEESKENFYHLRERQDYLVKKIRKAINDGKLKRVKKDLGMSE